MRLLTGKDKVVFWLGVLAFLQLAVLASCLSSFHPPAAAWPKPGDTLEFTQAAGGGSHTPARTTVLLVFHSRCGHCLETAPIWAEWSSEPHPNFRVMGISSEPHDSARAYAAEQGWSFEIGPPETWVDPGVAAGLVRRTPWVFVVDESGVILAEGHGSRIGELIQGMDRTAGAEAGL
jgi:thiol-disulfide isomerase/thioredoxin